MYFQNKEGQWISENQLFYKEHYKFSINISRLVAMLKSSWY